MKFQKELNKYLNGDKFDSGLTIPISNKYDKLINRQELIIQFIKNKKVMHLGCCDHKSIIKGKIKDGSWMHQKITENAFECLGIDIEKDTVEYVRSEFKYENIIYGDITDKKKIKEVENNKFDIMIMGEILEHVDNPVLFLKQIRENYKNNISQILITVPNAFSYRNMKSIKKHQEVINSDHRYWFTPYTLAKIVTLAGYKVDEFFFTDEMKNKIGLKAKLLVIPFLKRKLLYNRIRKFPALRINLVMIINF